MDKEGNRTMGARLKLIAAQGHENLIPGALGVTFLSGTALPPLMLSRENAFRMLDIGVAYGNKLIGAGMIPTVRLGSRVLVPLKELERMVDTLVEEQRGDRGSP